MAHVTYYLLRHPTLHHCTTADDGVAPGETVECQSASGAIFRAEVLSRVAGNIGAVAFQSHWRSGCW
jgi:hypothetical protein